MRQKIGEYPVIRKIGRGGMATVYEVEPKFSTDGRKALKVFSCESGNVRELKKKFMAEAEFLHKYNHAGLAHVSDLARENDPPYFVMDLVVSPSGEPKSLQDRFGERNITPNEALKWFGQLCEVVAFVHESGLVHRDIKPGNILLDEHDDIVLVDFGVAKIVDETTLRELRSERTMVTGATADCPAVLGTREYLPPEVTDNPVATEAWDVWAIGMVFFKILLRYSWDFTLNDVQELRECLEGVDYAEFWKDVLPRFLEKNPNLRAKGLNRFAAWARDVLSERQVKFKHDHQPLIDSLKALNIEGLRLSMTIIDDSDLAVNSAPEDDEGAVSRFLRKGLSFYGASKFSADKSLVKEFLAKCTPVLNQANDIIKEFRQTPFEFDDLWIDRLEYIAPASAESVELGWANAFNALDEGLSAVLHSIERAQKQIELFAEGRFGESVLDLERRERERREAADKDREESIRAPILKGESGDQRVSLAMEEVRDVPFAYNDVSSVAVFLECWYVWQRTKCWKSADAKNWEEVPLPDELFNAELKVVDSVLVAFGSEKCSYTSDGREWRSVKFDIPADPKAHNVFPVDLFMYQGKWLLQVSRCMPYSYIEVGIFKDSTKTSYCSSTCFYAADILDGPWMEASVRPSAVGEEIQKGALCVTQRRLSAVSSYDYNYRKAKQIENRHPHFVFTTPDGYWANAELKVTSTNFDRAAKSLESFDIRIVQTPIGALCLTRDAIFRSDDGRTWELVRIFEDHAPDFKTCVVVDSLICLPGYRNGRIWISSDGRTFTEMSIDIEMSYVAPKGDELLVIDCDARRGRVCKCKFTRMPL